MSGSEGGGIETNRCFLPLLLPSLDSRLLRGAVRAVCHCFGRTIGMIKRKVVQVLRSEHVPRISPGLETRSWPAALAGHLASGVPDRTRSATKWVTGLLKTGFLSIGPRKLANRYILQLRCGIGDFGEVGYIVTVALPYAVPTHSHG
jgi:hypothetical protein